MMNIVFFGDSFTEALNNNFDGFVSKMKLDEKGYCVKNYGVSGTTLAPYSLYPVGNNDLLFLINQHRDDIENADIVFLEYGINDFAAVAVGYIRNIDVQIAFTKCVDCITQINSDCKIIYLAPSFSTNVIKLISQSQQQYIINEYFEMWSFKYSSVRFVKGFQDFINRVSTKIPIIEMICDSDFMLYNIDETDHIHPNDVGYQIIAKNVLTQLEHLIK